MSLQTKGMLAFVVLMIYAAGLTVFVLDQKEALIAEVEQLRSVYEHEGAVSQSDLATLRTLQNLRSQILVNNKDIDKESLRDQLALVRSLYEGLPMRYPGGETTLLSLQGALDEAYINPTLASVSALRYRLQDAEEMLGQRIDQIREQQSSRVDGFRSHSNSVALAALVIGVLGLIAIGVTSGRFLKAISRDLKTLEIQTAAVGKREGLSADLPGSGLPQRGDEIGKLSDALERMTVELEERERRTEIEREKYIHQEKTAAIGTLAAGIIHEIGNPVTSIAELVRAIRDNDESPNPDHEEMRTNCDAVLQNLERIVAIVRDVSEFSTCPSTERELLDLNQLIRTTYRLMRYDKRLLKVGCALELDRELPPVEGNEEQLIQVIMSMLVNAADAVEGVTSRVPVITISTRAEDDRLHLVIRDNGCGMDEEAQRHVFDPFYSTKSVDRGTGLGLTLCQSIVTEHGGEIEIESLVDIGTTVHIYLPRTAPES
ncbi:MAG: GHKL domain-containing protein [Gammaproteobacteria bacterium]|nr:MAG: GHKL domain-containing protein [Gammaproteobacteria bacterium]